LIAKNKIICLLYNASILLQILKESLSERNNDNEIKNKNAKQERSSWKKLEESAMTVSSGQQQRGTQKKRPFELL